MLSHWSGDHHQYSLLCLRAEVGWGVMASGLGTVVD